MKQKMTDIYFLRFSAPYVAPIKKWFETEGEALEFAYRFLDKEGIRAEYMSEFFDLFKVNPKHKSREKPLFSECTYDQWALRKKRLSTIENFSED